MFPVLELLDVRFSGPHASPHSSSISHGRFYTPSSPDDAHAGGGRTPLLLAPERDGGDDHHAAAQPASTSSPALSPLPPRPVPPPQQQPRGGGGGGSSSSKHDGYGALHSPPALLSFPPQPAAAAPPHHDQGPGRLHSWLLPPPGHYSRRRPLPYLGSRAAAVLLASLAAHLLPEFELVVAFVGGLGASLLAFVVPGLLALRCYPRAPPVRRAGFVGLVVFGVVGGGLGAGYALRDMVRGQSQC